jgi:hypothetical protein
MGTNVAKKKKKPSYPPFTLRLTEETMGELKEVASLMGISPTDLIRLLISRFLPVFREEYRKDRGQPGEGD